MRRTSSVKDEQQGVGMAKGGPARGGKGHITGPCLDTNVSSMTTCTWKPSSESSGANQEEMDKEERDRHY